jgi:hypothetical protein
MRLFADSVDDEAGPEWLRVLGHEVLHGPDIAFGWLFPERTNRRDVLLFDPITDAVNPTNSNASPEAPEDAIC